MRKNWEISKLATPEYAPEFSIYSVESGKDIARVIGNDSEENAKLLAAAPDILQACQNALASLEAQDNIHALPIAIWDAMQEMRAAIAMAKG